MPSVRAIRASTSSTTPTATTKATLCGTTCRSHRTQPEARSTGWCFLPVYAAVQTERTPVCAPLPQRRPCKRAHYRPVNVTAAAHAKPDAVVCNGA